MRNNLKHIGKTKLEYVDGTTLEADVYARRVWLNQLFFYYKVHNRWITPYEIKVKKIKENLDFTLVLTAFFDTEIFTNYIYSENPLLKRITKEDSWKFSKTPVPIEEQ